LIAPAGTGASMGHQHRYVHISEDIARDPAKDHFAQAGTFTEFFRALLTSPGFITRDSE